MMMMMVIQIIIIIKKIIIIKIILILITDQSLRAKHPPAPHDRKSTPSPTGSARFEPLQMCPDDVIKCLRTFPAGSSGGPHGLAAQHLTDMLNY